MTRPRAAPFPPAVNGDMEHHGEKTEQATPRRMEDAQKRGQIPRSAEVQTVVVLTAGLTALMFVGRESWTLLANSFQATLGHLHDTPVSQSMLPGYAISGTLILLQCAGPLALAAVIGALVAGGLQSRFSTASEALTPNWERLDPVAGLQRIFSARAAVPLAIAMLKFAVLLALSYSAVREVLGDPVFRQSVGVARLGAFLAEATIKLTTRVLLVMGVIAAADYAYQFWRHQRDLMMTRDELKEEMKNSEGNPLFKAARRRIRGWSKRKMLAQVPQADVVVTNPTFIAVALKYDPKTMKAPKIVAKGIRLNAARIRELARQHGVPIVENKPLARLMFRHGKVGGEVPAQLFVAVAEVLAWVYRVHRHRYPIRPEAIAGSN